ncbi:MAG: metallophosphoesterase [Caldicoprobacterales bacterium]|jgi:predicted MPP superfamily phosphohydrolase|nr:metallophosphoesterase [Clostridiales bacterium]
MKIRRKRITILIVLLVMLAFVIWQNNSITITSLEFYNPEIQEEFNEFTIAHISDLHNRRFGSKQSILLNKLASTSPDLIVITGDLIDRRNYSLDIAMEFIEGALEIAPVYYVSGNHEAWSGKFDLIRENLEQAGVSVLDNTESELPCGDSSILLLGLSDPDFFTSHYFEGTNTSAMEDQLRKWSDYDSFKILLSHRPELFDLYAENKMDLIFAGHAHGGQFRIPFIGGVVAPDQGLFPEYTSGSHTKNNSTMFVSRGLGNSIIPVRIFNRPEIVVVTLKAGKPPE